MKILYSVFFSKLWRHFVAVNSFFPVFPVCRVSCPCILLEISICYNFFYKMKCKGPIFLTDFKRVYFFYYKGGNSSVPKWILPLWSTGPPSYYKHSSGACQCLSTGKKSFSCCWKSDLCLLKYSRSPFMETFLKLLPAVEVLQQRPEKWRAGEGSARG